MIESIEKKDGSCLWEELPRFFMSPVEFIVNKSVYKSGIMLNYKTVSNQYRVKFKGDARIMTLPFPFEIYVSDDTIYMDYRPNETLFNGDEKLINTLKKVKKEDLSFFYDKILILKKVR